MTAPDREPQELCMAFSALRSSRHRARELLYTLFPLIPLIKLLPRAQGGHSNGTLELSEETGPESCMVGASPVPTCPAQFKDTDMISSVCTYYF